MKQTPISPETTPPSSCRAWAEPLALAAWTGETDPPLAAHLAACAACREAHAREAALAARAQASLAQGAAEKITAADTRRIADEVFARTTRRALARRSAGARLAWAALGSTAVATTLAGYLFFVKRPEMPPLQESEINFADFNVDLLENLDVAERLELLEHMEELEAMNDG